MVWIQYGDEGAPMPAGHLGPVGFVTVQHDGQILSDLGEPIARIVEGGVQIVGREDQGTFEFVMVLGDAPR